VVAVSEYIFIFFLNNVEPQVRTVCPTPRSASEDYAPGIIYFFFIFFQK
jgi:hypothetical protein